MSSNTSKNELANHIYQYLCHEAQYSDLPEGARESLTAASECIEQAYKLNVNNNITSSSILPDELLRIFTRHKEFLASASSPSGNVDSSNINSSSSSGYIQQNESSAGTSGNSKLSGHLIPRIHHHHSFSRGVSVHQKKLKQKLIALIKKFRTNASDFDSEEQYREALERELMKAADGRGSRAIEELLEEDIDVEGDSGSEPEDWDNISETSTPKPSLRPFFSSTTLDKI